MKLASFLPSVIYTSLLGLSSCDAQSQKQAESDTSNKAPTEYKYPTPKNATEACVQAIWYAERKANVIIFHRSQMEFLLKLEESEPNPSRRDQALANNAERVSQFVEESKALAKGASESFGTIAYENVNPDIAKAVKDYSDATIATAYAIHNYWALKYKVVEALQEGSPTRYSEAKFQSLKAWEDYNILLEKTFIKKIDKFRELTKSYTTQ